MKTITQAVLCAVLFLANFAIAHAQQITEQFVFSVNEVKISQSNGYDLVHYENMPSLHGQEHVGDPQLPIKHFNLLLPKGATATNVSISVAQETQLSGNFTIYPVQTPYAPDFSGPPPFVGPNPSIYNSNTPFPADPLVSYSTHVYREYSYVEISFIPFSYLPQSGQLYLLTSLNINVNYSVNSNTEAVSLRPTDYGDELALGTMCSIPVRLI